MIEIQKASAEDADTLAAILTEAKQLKISLNDDAWASRDFTPELLREWIEEGNTYSVRLNGRIVATFALTWEDTTWGQQPPVAGYIHKLAVNGDVRGKGIGGDILNWASIQIMKKGRQLLRLDFPRENSGLKTYYERHGFKWVRDEKVIRPNKIYLESLYERPVA